MEKMIKVKTGFIDQEKINSVFCAIICKNGKPYSKSGLAKENGYDDISIPLVLMQMRWNGQLGFGGGKVDQEDKDKGIVTPLVLKQVAIRELQEEINLDVKVNLEELKPLTTFLYKDYVIHNFVYEVDYNTMLRIYKNSVNSESAMSESCGSVVLQLGDYGKRGGLKEVLKNNFCATSKEELKEVIKYLGLEI